MLSLFTLVVVVAVAYTFFAQGLLTAFTMLVNVLLAGVIAFNFWEPLAGELEQSLSGTFAEGYEDWICIMGLFCPSLLALRVLSNAIATTEPELPTGVRQGGAIVFGALTGYVLAGFLVCAMQTLPIPEDFFGFSAKIDPAGGLRRFLPADRVWLGLMRAASMGSLYTEGDGFDPRGYFEQGYLRHRRYGEKRDPVKYLGEDLPLDHGEMAPQP